MNIGNPQREIYVEPLELPEAIRPEKPEHVEQPDYAEPERVDK